MRMHQSVFRTGKSFYDDFVKKRDDGYASIVESKVNRSESELELDNEAPVSATLQLKTPISLPRLATVL